MFLGPLTGMWFWWASQNCVGRYCLGKHKLSSDLDWEDPQLQTILIRVIFFGDFLCSMKMEALVWRCPPVRGEISQDPSFPRRNNKNRSNNDFLQLFVSHDDCLQFKTKFKSYTQTVSTRTLQDLRDFKDILVMIKVPAVIVRFLDFQRYKWLTAW